MYKVKKLTVGQLSSNCYFVINNRKCLIIDPGDEADFISDKIKELKIKPLAILATHGHFDHNMAALELTLNYNIPYFINKKDMFIIKYINKSAKHWQNRKDVLIPGIKTINNNSLSIGKIDFEVIDIPGHTPGSVAYYNKKENILFSGDLIFEGGGVGRTDFSYSNVSEFKVSLENILKLPKNTTVYPGHGDEFTLSSFPNLFN